MEEQTFPSELITLPSKGLLYAEDSPLKKGEVEMKYMTAREEDILTNVNFIKNGTVLDKLIQSLMVDKFNYDEKSKDSAGHSKRFTLDLCLERIAFLSIMENEKFQSMEMEVSKILKKIDIKNYTFTSQKIDKKKLEEMHKAKHG